MYKGIVFSHNIVSAHSNQSLFQFVQMREVPRHEQVSYAKFSRAQITIFQKIYVPIELIVNFLQLNNTKVTSFILQSDIEYERTYV